MKSKRNTCEKSLADVIGSASETRSYMRYRGLSHGNYKYHSHKGTVEKILDGGHLLLSDGSRWNDKRDAVSFNSDRFAVKKFGACFSFSLSESVAMWAMYAKPDSENPGAMLDITGSQMAAIIDSVSEVELLSWNGKDYDSMGFLGKGSFTIYLQDVLYAGETDKNGKCPFKRSSEFVKCSRSKADALLNNGGIIQKGYPWSYENECRLVVEIKRSACDSTVDYVQIRIPDSVREELLKRVVLSPGSELPASSSYKRSKLHGLIEWR